MSDSDIEESNKTIVKLDTEEIDSKDSIEEDIRNGLELGDIIEIVAPTNPDINEEVFLITYIDEKVIQLINIATKEFRQLNIAEDGGFTDESITNIYLRSRSPTEGYARQHGLIQNTWISIYFGGDTPSIITGEITNLVEDQIEVTTYPDLKIIYLDFEYKGFPLWIPNLEKIVKRKKPSILKDTQSLKDIRENVAESEAINEALGQTNGKVGEDVQEASIEYLDTGESIIHMPEDAEPESNIYETLRTMYAKTSSGIVFGNRLDAIEQIVELPENQRRYGIETQTNSLLDELLSAVPSVQRTQKFLTRVHTIIERFKELRQEFSIFDENGDVRRIRVRDQYSHKPLVDHLYEMDKNVRWFKPVTSIKRKGYLLAEDAEEQFDSALDMSFKYIYDSLLEEEEMKRVTYYKNDSNSEENKYSNMHQQLNQYLTPFLKPDNPSDSFLNVQTINANIESIVSNKDDTFESSVLLAKNKSTQVQNSNFVLQNYNVGINKLVKEMIEGVERPVVKQMTPNDRIHVKSFVSLPDSVMRFSRIDLPGTNLLDRAILHQNFFMTSLLLRKNLDVLPKIVDDLSKEIDYKKLDEEGGKPFLSQMTEYILDPTAANNANKYMKFLNVIVPKTFELIRITRKYIVDKISFKDVVDNLEPFFVYTSDITFPQYKEIRYFLRERIKEVRKELFDNSKLYETYRTRNLGIEKMPVIILNLLKEKREFIDDLLHGYRTLPTEAVMQLKWFSVEILEKMMIFDCATLYTKLIALLMSSLMTPNSLADALEATSDQYKGMDEQEKIKAKDCNQRTLTKRYDSVLQLQKDNNTDDVYYDEEFDDTPYYIGEKYKTEQKEKLPEKYPGWLKEVLIQKHDCPKDLADDMAERLIARKRRVKDGEYAILELVPVLPKGVELTEKEQQEADIEIGARRKLKFYQRKKNSWVEDRDIDEDAFLDSSTLFCNLSKKCYQRIAGPMDSKCEAVDSAEARMQQEARKKALKEFDRRYEKSSEQMVRELEKSIDEQIKHMFRLDIYKYAQLHKHNNVAYELGLQVKAPDDLIRSPYARLRNIILGEPDFAKKQRDILRFYDEFCRDPRTTDDFGEDPHFKYCLKTDTKLIADFHIYLAKSFILYGQTDYGETLQQLCAERGMLSEDGDSIIDKYSGEVMRQIDFADEENFTVEGFRIQTHAIMENDRGSNLFALLNKKQDCVYENKQMEEICKIYIAIASNIGLPVEEFKSYALSYSYAICETNIVAKDEYEKYVERMIKEKGKRPISYEKKKNKTMIHIVAGVILVLIQTSIPHFKTKKTQPGCLKSSFGGFPLTGPENLEGVKYLGCVLDKMKATYEPWDSLNKIGAAILAEQLRETIESAVMKNPAVDDLFLEKREYLLLHPLTDDDIPLEHSLTKWTNFLPPILDTNVLPGIKSVAEDFAREYMQLLRNGNKGGLQDFLVLKSKIAQYGYGIIETVQQYVSKKNLLLKTGGNTPFLQNACCNEEGRSMHPLSYFAEEDDASMLNNYTKTIRSLSALVNYNVKVGKAPSLFNDQPTGIVYESMPTAPTTENIYSAFIYYCGLDKGFSIAEPFTRFFQEIPAGYNAKSSIEEKIAFLKHDAHKQFGLAEYQQLMQLVNKQNVIHRRASTRFNAVGALQDLLNTFEQEQSTFTPEPFLNKLRELLEEYKPNTMRSYNELDYNGNQKEKEDDDGIQLLNQLKDYLSRVNKRMYETIMKFLNKNGSLKRKGYDGMHEFLSKISNWKINAEQKTPTYYDNGLYTVWQYFKNIVYEFTHVFPNMLLNNVKNKRIHKYWELGQNDEMDLLRTINEYYAGLESFRGDTTLVRLLLEMQQRLTNIYLFVQNLPVYTPIIKGDTTFYSLFDKNTVYYLLTYSVYSILYEFVQAADDDNLLRQDINEQKILRRKDIIERRDPGQKITAEFVELPEEYDDAFLDLAEVQIDIGNKEEFKKRVGALLVAFLNIAEKNKKIIDLTYDDISFKIRGYKQKEKARIVERLRNMSIEDRRVENEKKKFKLGEWNVGQQKGLFVYDEKTSDRERVENLTQGFVDIDQELALRRKEDEDMDNAMGIEDLDASEARQEEINIENEGLDFQHFGENYMDGGYYSEDADEDFPDE